MNKFFLKLSLILSAIAPAFSTAGVLGDRLVMSINNMPYSQLQIESYLNTKEALRSDATKSQLVNATNWQVAVEAFLQDMAVYQEAVKSSGFRPQREHIQKSLERITETTSSLDRFRERFHQLGLDEGSQREQIVRILTVENLRRSRQGIDRGKDTGKEKEKGRSSGTPSQSSAWEVDLQKNLVVRWFEGGKTYEPIQPVPNR